MHFLIKKKYIWQSEQIHFKEAQTWAAAPSADAIKGQDAEAQFVVDKYIK